MYVSEPGAAYSGASPEMYSTTAPFASSKCASLSKYRCANASGGSFLEKWSTRCEYSFGRPHVGSGAPVTASWMSWVSSRLVRRGRSPPGGERRPRRAGSHMRKFLRRAV